MSLEHHGVLEAKYIEYTVCSWISTVQYCEFYGKTTMKWQNVISTLGHKFILCSSLLSVMFLRLEFSYGF